MTPAWLSALPHTEPRSESVCLSLPGYLLSTGRHDVARDVLVDIASHAREGLSLDKISRGEPDPCGTLWFARAAYMFKGVSPDGAWAQQLLPSIKKAAQTVISGKTQALRMDDGGMLAPADSSGSGTVCPMGQNALWYFTLSMLAEELHAIKDPAGDHFERLAGRFRRSFSKTFWCSAHGFLCDPALQKAADHATAHTIPDPAQLLVATLPFSPIPRTKQRQMVLAVREKALAPRGVIVPAASREGGLKETAGRADVASSIHLSWLSESLLVTADVRERAAAECRAMLPPAGPQARFYVDGAPAAIPENVDPHGPSTAEAARVRQLCGG